MKWEVLNKSKKDIIDILLENRNIENKEEFFNPPNPSAIPLSLLGIKNTDIKKAIKRIGLAKKNNEEVIVYGDYDADGITATAILWEALHSLGLNVLPHIPDRFEEGYGLNSKGVENVKLQMTNAKLIITVDNGIVAYDGIKKANELGIDVIVIDHHTKGKVLPSAYCLIHTDKVCGSALTYFFARELSSQKDSLELAAIGTIADQMPLVGINRSIVKYGLSQLNQTKRPGLKELFMESGIVDEGTRTPDLGTYEINYIIAPRINAMGRLAQGIESLRLICTKRTDKARELSTLLAKTNLDRQKTVEMVVSAALSEIKNESKGSTNKVIVIANETYHEGVIGLAAGRLVEEFYRPAIVLSVNGDISKASARSISGFNIIEAIKGTGVIKEGGGHPMAAGFSIETTRINEFREEINRISDELLTDELLERKLRIDCEVNFDQITPELVEVLKQFEPIGLGNPAPVFCTKNVKVVEAKPVGREGKHLKLKLKQDDKIFDAIWFSVPANSSSLISHSSVDVVYSVEENIWNNHTFLQLKIKDIKT
jgi:single-stranded-DNA-specific exonuclease